MNKNNLSIPMSIIVAGALIAFAVFFAVDKDAGEDNKKEAETQGGKGEILSLESITEEDYITGNPEAEIFVVTYSDVECPYCKKLHETMLEIIKNEDYFKDGKVAWVLRQMPIPQLHPLAIEKSSALLCSGILGSNETFWNYTNKIFEEIPTNGSMDLSRFSEIAVEQGFEKTNFEECMEKESTKEKINEDLKSGSDAGARGTPFNIIVSKNGNTPIPGAQPYENINSAIKNTLNSN